MPLGYKGDEPAPHLAADGAPCAQCGAGIFFDAESGLPEIVTFADRDLTEIVWRSFAIVRRSFADSADSVDAVSLGYF